MFDYTIKFKMIEINNLILKRERKIHLSQDGGGLRILGYVYQDDSMIAIYIIEKLNNNRYASVNLITGNWGDSSVGLSKQAIFTVFSIDPEPGFKFCDYNEKMKIEYSKLSDDLLNRDKALESKNLNLFKKILDVIYVKEICYIFPTLIQ